MDDEMDDIEEVLGLAEELRRQADLEEVVAEHDLEEPLNDRSVAPRQRASLEGFPNPRVRRPL